MPFTESLVNSEAWQPSTLPLPAKRIHSRG